MNSRSSAGDARKKSGPSVLVVDDDPGTLESMTALLRCGQISVHGAPSGEEALALARQEWLDLAIIDYACPVSADFSWPGMSSLATTFRAKRGRRGAPSCARGKTSIFVPERCPGDALE